MDVILIAGLWLPRTLWSDVVNALADLGHRAIPVALPGVDDPTDASLDDQLTAVVTAIDGADRPLVVGHSAAATLAWMAADRRADRVAGVALVGGFPAAAGEAYADFLPIVDGAMPFPGWEPFEGPDSDDLDEAMRDRIASEAVPVPEAVAKGTVTYTNDRRHDTPLVLVCPEYTPEQAKAWLTAGEIPELDPTSDLAYVDIASGHWPMVSMPDELARVLDHVARGVATKA